MSIELFGVRLRIGFPAAVFFAFVFNTASGARFGISFAVILAHELTHLVCLLFCGCANITVDILPGGISIGAGGMEKLSYRQTALCALSAPAVNLVFGGLLLLFGKTSRFSFLADAGTVSLVLGAMNLLPFSFLDGGRAAESLLLMIQSPEDADKILKKAETAALTVTLLLTVLPCFFGKGSLFLFAFLGYCIYSRVKT